MTTIDSINVSYSRCVQIAVENLIAKKNFSEKKTTFYTVFEKKYFFNRTQLENEISSVMSKERESVFLSDLARLRAAQLLIEKPLEELRSEYRKNNLN